MLSRSVCACVEEYGRAPRRLTRRPRGPDQPRLVTVGRDLGVAVPVSASKEAQIAALLPAPGLQEILRLLGRDELRAACRTLGLDDSGRSRPALMARLLESADASTASTASTPSNTAPAFAAVPSGRFLPESGDIVRVRHRQYLVEEVVPGGDARLAACSPRAR